MLATMSSKPKTTKRKRGVTAEHAESLLRRYESLAKRIDVWVPPRKMLEDMRQEELMQADRLELVVAYYAADNGGNSPPFEEIARWMGIAKKTAHQIAMNMAAHGRAVSRRGKFWLTASEYTHPLIKNNPRLSSQLMPAVTAEQFIEEIDDLIIKDMQEVTGELG